MQIKSSLDLCRLRATSLAGFGNWLGSKGNFGHQRNGSKILLILVFRVIVTTHELVIRAVERCSLLHYLLSLSLYSK
jgi:hypothetical protein